MTAAARMSFSQMLDALKTRFPDIYEIELYEEANGYRWDIDQLSDAVEYEAEIKVDDTPPTFEIDGNTIHEYRTIESKPYHLVYTVRKTA